jgi:hypothetical protein
LYIENHLIKVIEEDTNKWEDMSCSQTERITILKCPYYSLKVIYRVSVTSYQNSNSTRHWWLTLIILAILEAEIGRIMI